MYEQIEKPKENKSRVVANSVAQKKSNVMQMFVDNRSEAISLRKVQDMAIACPSVRQLRASQEMIINSQKTDLPNGNVVQRVLIDNDFATWIDHDLNGAPAQLDGVRDAIDAYNANQNPELRLAANQALYNLAGVLSGGVMTQNVFQNLQPVIPGLQQEHIALQATYNFDGPISLSLENVLAWLRIANGAFTLDDVRYVRHELVEIRALQDNEAPAVHLQGPDARPIGDAYDAFFEGGEDEVGFNETYEQAHGAAIGEEVQFLTRAVNRANPELNATVNQVAHSHPTRAEEFLVDFPTEVEEDELFNDQYEIQLDRLENYNLAVRDALGALTLEGFNLEEDQGVFRIDNLPQVDEAEEEAPQVGIAPPIRRNEPVRWAGGSLTLD